MRPNSTAEIITGQNLLQEIAEQTGGREYNSPASRVN